MELYEFSVGEYNVRFDPTDPSNNNRLRFKNAYVINNKYYPTEVPDVALQTNIVYDLNYGIRPITDINNLSGVIGVAFDENSVSYSRQQILDYMLLDQMVFFLDNSYFIDTGS